MTHPTPERLGAYLDGELDAGARAAVDTHLVECAECAAHVADLSAVDDAAREVPLAAPAGYFEDFAPRVRARLETRTRRWHPPVWGWAAAAALLLAVVTPLALRDAGAPRDAPMAKMPSDAPMAEMAQRFERSGGSDFKQDAVPPATTAPRPAAKPAAPGAALSLPAPAAEPETAARLRDTRANAALESRVLRRDRAEPDAAAGADAPVLAPPQAIRPPQEEQSKRERDALVLQDTSKLAKDDDENRRALGYVAPPPAPPPAAATGQRQVGPRSQNTASPATGGAARKAAESKTAEPAKDKEQAADAVAEKSAEAGVGGMQESVTVTRDSVDLAAGRESMKFRSLARSKPPRSDAEARTLRESWRVFAGEHPDHPEADEARVRMVEAGALAYRLGRRPQDREIALRDARDYLERPLTPQAARVRAVLKELDPAAGRR